MIGAVLLLLTVALVVAAVVTVVRRLGGRHHSGADGGSLEGHVVRQFFEYLLLLALLVVVAIGLSGLIAAAFASGSTIVVSDSAVARSVAFTAVGLPLLAVVALAVRRDFARDAGEARSLPWLLYLSAASLVSLVVALFALHDTLCWLLDLRAFDPGAPARAVVWTAAWAAHWWLVSRQDDRRPLQPLHLAGSLLGLALGLVGLGVMLAGALAHWLGLAGDTLVVGRHEPILEGTVTFALAAAVWVRYWLLAGLRSPRSVLWHAYVLLAGVASGLVVTLTATSVALDRALVWLLGDPWSEEARRYFESMPATLATVVVGALTLAYHRGVLSAVEHAGRTEVERVRDYLLAAVGLGAAATGTTIVVVALVEAATDPSIVHSGGAGNTLIAALTLLGVGGPVWWLFWRRGQAADGVAEAASPTRRLYLFLLLGLTSLASVGALLAGAWIVVDRVLQDEAASVVVRDIRFPVGILATATAVAAYHWAAYRTDRSRLPQERRTGPSFVLLLGVADASTAAAVQRRTGATTWAWTREDAVARGWSEDELVAVVEGARAREVVVLDEDGALRVVPVSRRAPLPASTSSEAADAPQEAVVEPT